MDRNELKIQALKERIGSLTVAYEDQDADRRVEITLLRTQNQELSEQIATVTQQLEEAQAPKKTARKTAAK